MPSNTDLADVNEIYVGFLLAGKKWFDNDAKSQFEKKSKIIGKELTEIQKARAEAMVEEVIKWAKSKKYSGRVKKVWWTARPNSLSNAVGKKVDSRKNPTDILVQFTSGPAEGFLGISAKSTSGSGDIGFKNPGIGTVEATLNINLSDIVSTTVAKAVQKFKLPENTAARKEEIRKSPKIQEQTQTIGTELLNKIRDIMYEKLNKLDNKKLKNYILENWLDVSNDLYPPYIKVTGMGSKLGQIKAKVDDPLNNEKLGAILKNNLRLEKVGNDSIGLYAGPQKILKMRAKFESEKLASSLKFSGDPW